MILQISTNKSPYNIQVKNNSIKIENNDGYYLESDIHPIDCKFLKIYEDTRNDLNHLLVRIKDNCCFVFTELLYKLLPTSFYISKQIDVKKEKISDMLYFQSEIIVNNCILNKGPNDSLFFGKDMPKFEIKYNIINNKTEWVLNQLKELSINRDEKILVLHSNENDVMLFSKLHKENNFCFIRNDDFYDFPIFKNFYKFIYITDFRDLLMIKNKHSSIQEINNNIVHLKLKNLSKLGSKFLINNIYNKDQNIYSPIFCFPYFHSWFDKLTNSNLLWFSEYFKTVVSMNNFEEIKLSRDTNFEKIRSSFSNITNEKKYFLYNYLPKITKRSEINSKLKKIKNKKTNIQQKINILIDRIRHLKEDELDNICGTTHNTLIKNKIDKLNFSVGVMENNILKYLNSLDNIKLIEYKYNQLIKFDDEYNKEKDSKIDCPICLEDKNIEDNTILLSCFHTLCLSCSKKLFDNKTEIRCPLCRHNSKINECFIFKNRDVLSREYIEPKLEYIRSILENNLSDCYIFIFENHKEKKENDDIFKSIVQKIKKNKEVSFELILESITCIKKIRDLINRKIKQGKRIELVFSGYLKNIIIDKFMDFSNSSNLTIKSIS